MSLIIATGSNLGNSLEILTNAKELLSRQFQLIASSRIYTSQAVEITNQPDFFNQVLEFSLPPIDPHIVMKELLKIEEHFGRIRTIKYGPRTLDLDMIFWSDLSLSTDDLILPHPRWAERSFIVRPLQELPFFKTIEKCFTIPKIFPVEAQPLLS